MKAFLFPEELRCLLAENELRIQAIQATWEYRLEEARKEWEQQYAAVNQVETSRSLKSWEALPRLSFSDGGEGSVDMLDISGCFNSLDYNK